MTEAEMKFEARMLAIEYMTANVYVVLHRLFQTPPNVIDKQEAPAVRPGPRNNLV